jgi:hypothetical protein
MQNTKRGRLKKKLYILYLPYIRWVKTREESQTNWKIKKKEGNKEIKTKL